MLTLFSYYSARFSHLIQQPCLYHLCFDGTFALVNSESALLLDFQFYIHFQALNILFYFQESYNILSCEVLVPVFNPIL